MHQEDIEGCYRASRLRPLFNAEERGVILQGWRLLIQEGSPAAVAEDLTRPPGNRILSFFLGAFVREDWFQQAERGQSPMLGLRLLRDLGRGRSPLLQAAEIARCNSGAGLHVAVVHADWREDEIAEPLCVEVQRASVRMFVEAHAGYRVQSLLSELHGDHNAESATKGNTWFLRSGFPDVITGTHPLNTPYLRPRLFGLNREEAQQNPNHILGPLFSWREPVFCFSPSQQRFLGIAMAHFTDRDLMEALERAEGTRIAEDAIGRRFGRIFQRVRRLQNPAHPVLLETLAPSQMRPRLMEYLNRHWEELRPHEFQAPGLRTSVTEGGAQRIPNYSGNSPLSRPTARGTRAVSAAPRVNPPDPFL